MGFAPGKQISNFPGGSEVKASACNVGDLGSIPEPGRSLEKEMAIHSSILAWRISWTEEPGEPQSTGQQRVRRDLATLILNLSVQFPRILIGVGHVSKPRSLTWCNELLFYPSLFASPYKSKFWGLYRKWGLIDLRQIFSILSFLEMDKSVK